MMVTIPVRRGWIEDIPNSHILNECDYFNYGSVIQLTTGNEILQEKLKTYNNKIKVADLSQYSAVVFIRVGVSADIMKITSSKVKNYWFGVVLELTTDSIVIMQAKHAYDACETSAFLSSGNYCREQAAKVQCK